MREGKRQPGWMRRRLRVRRPIGGSERVRRWLRFAGPRRGTMPDAPPAPAYTGNVVPLRPAA